MKTQICNRQAEFANIHTVGAMNQPQGPLAFRRTDRKNKRDEDQGVRTATGAILVSGKTTSHMKAANRCANCERRQNPR